MSRQPKTCVATLGAELLPAGARAWSIVDEGASVATFGRSELRVSLSWKADVFPTADDARRADTGVGDIDLDGVLARFGVDLSARRVEVSIPDEDPVQDPAFIALLQEQYVRYASVGSAA